MPSKLLRMAVRQTGTAFCRSFVLFLLAASVAAQDRLPAPVQANEQALRAINAYQEQQAERERAEERIRLQHRISATSVSRQEYEAAWRVNAKIVDQPAREAIDKLFAELQVPLVAEPAVARLLDQKVTLECRDCSRFEVIERICQQVGVYPDYSELEDSGSLFPLVVAFGLCLSADCDLNPKQESATNGVAEEPPRHGVHLRAGKRPYPLLFAGPCAVEVVSLMEHPPYTTGNLLLRVLSAGLPESIATIRRMKGTIQTQFMPLTDQDNATLSLKQEFSQIYGNHPTFHVERHYWELTRLLRSATELRIGGKVELAIPTEVATLDVPRFEPGATAEAGDWRLSVRSLEELESGRERTQGEQAKYQWSVELTVPLLELSAVKDLILLLDADGNEVRPALIATDQLSASTDAVGSFRVSYLGFQKPARVVVKVLGRAETVKYAFRGTLPLQAKNKQPLEVPELKFEGDAPATIDVKKLLSGDGELPRINLLVRNHSNKDFEAVRFRTIFLDANQKELDDSSGLVRGARYFLHETPRLVAAGQSIEQTEVDASMPRQTRSTRIELQRVEFLDGTTWRTAADKDKPNRLGPVWGVTQMPASLETPAP